MQVYTCISQAGSARAKISDAAGDSGPGSLDRPRQRTYRSIMQYLMLMWADADAASGDESDFQAWATFDQQVRAAGAFVANGALMPAASDARLVRTAIAGHHLPDAVEHKPFADGKRQIQAFYLMECEDMGAALEWANRLPTYGYVEVRELIQY